VNQCTRPPTDLPLYRTAFFLDLDGTLSEIVSDPRQACIAPSVLVVLDRLASVSGGAVAVISGRDIARIDHMLHPLRLAAAGVHGVERRDAAGHLTRLNFDQQAHETLAADVRKFAAALDGLHVEPKPGSVALHFRNRPDLEPVCRQFMGAQADRDQRVSLMDGKMVLELIFGRQTKGDAILDMMKSPPFKGRRPFYAGDDVTDEAGFRDANRLNGVSVKVGAGPTCARHRLPDPNTFSVYLASLLRNGSSDAEHSVY
jgi:trehalose 6-phosphate phosphatase